MHDADGYRTVREDTLFNDITTYDYDTFGNLRGVVLPDGTDIEYLIDASDRRVGRIVDGVLTQTFLYQDALNPIAMLDSTGRVTQRYIYGTMPHVPDVMVAYTHGTDLNGDPIVLTETTYRYITDVRGSVLVVVNADTGVAVQELSYGPYGEVLSDSALLAQPFGFAGGLYDPETGLVRFGARDYDPETARWTAKDPIGFAGGETSLYSYIGADPLNSVDANGLRGGCPGGWHPEVDASGSATCHRNRQLFDSFAVQVFLPFAVGVFVAVVAPAIVPALASARVALFFYSAFTTSAAGNVSMACAASNGDLAPPGSPLYDNIVPRSLDEVDQLLETERVNELP